MQETRTVAVLGPKGAGKTALIDGMRELAAGNTGGAASRRNDKGGRAGLDDTPEEKAHQATLRSRVVRVPWKGKAIQLLDTPGEASFTVDTRLAVAAADAVLLVVSAKDGVKPGTERAFTWARQAGIPCLVAVTREDQDEVGDDAIVKTLHDTLHATVAAIDVPVAHGTLDGVVVVENETAWVDHPEHVAELKDAHLNEADKKHVEEVRAHLVEEVAGTDDALTDTYLTEGTLPQAALDEGLRKAVQSGRIVPVFFASSLEGVGIGALLDGLAELVPEPGVRAPWKGKGDETRAATPDAPVSVYIFKTVVDPHVGRASYARVLSGVLREGAHLVAEPGGAKERVATILPAGVPGAKAVPEATAGEIVVLPKLKTARTTHTLSDEKSPFELVGPELPTPLYARTIKLAAKANIDTVLTALQRLADEDPALSCATDPASGDLVLTATSPMHVAITMERLRQRVTVDLQLGAPRVDYRETVLHAAKNVEGKLKKQTGGHGQFAVCYIDLEPLPRGSGFVFEDAVVGGAVPRQFIPSVEKGVVKAMARGVLAGFPVVDVKVRLFDGKSHAVDSSDAAFQAAGYRAFIAAAKAAQPTLLEPVVRAQISVPEDSLGDVLGDLSGRHGKVLGTDSDGDRRVVTALVPLGSMLEYEPILDKTTRGRGSYTMAVERFDVAPQTVIDRVVRERAFDAAADDEK